MSCTHKSPYIRPVVLFCLLLASLNLHAQSNLIGPVYPPPLGASYSISGGQDAIGKAGGVSWTYYNINLVTHDTVYWGPSDGRIQISMNNNSYDEYEILYYRPEFSDLNGGIMVFTGMTFFYNSTTTIYTRCVVRVTTVSGVALPLIDATTVGLPYNVGAVGSLRDWGLTATGSFQVNMLFEASLNTTSFSPAFTFFDTNKPRTAQSQVFSSFTAGFYYVNSSPVLEINNAISMQANQIVSIPPTALRAWDLESSASDIHFRVGPSGVSGGHAPAHGVLLLNNTPIGLGASFTQNDINQQVVSYHHTGTNDAGDSFTFGITDGQGATVLAGNDSPFVFNIQIGYSNHPPQAVNDTGSGVVGTTFYGQFTATDPDLPAQTLSYSIIRNGTKGSATLLNFNDGSFSYVPQDDAWGADTLIFQVNDGLVDAADPGLFNIRIINNLAPVIEPIGDQLMEESEQRDILVEANDPDGNTVTLSVLNLPVFAAFSETGSGEGIIHLHPPFGAAGIYPGIELVATDNGRPVRTSRELFSLTVSPAIRPEISVVPADTFDFGLVSTGDDSRKFFKVYNLGLEILMLNNIELLTGDFSEFAVVNPGFPLAIPAGDSLELAVHFMPLSAGSKETRLVFTSDDPVNDTLEVTLLGQAVEIPRDVVYHLSDLKAPPGVVIEYPVSVKIAEVKEMCAFGFNLIFNSSILSYQGWSQGALIPDADYYIAAYLLSDSTLNISGFRKSGPAITGEGDIVVISFMVNPSAPLGPTGIKILSPSAGGCLGEDLSAGAANTGHVIVDLYAYLQGRFNYFDPLQQAAGRPLARIPVTLLDDNGIILKETITAEDGLYQFDSVLTLHDYTVSARWVDDEANVRLTVNPTDAYRAFAAVNGTLPFANDFQYEIGDVNNSNSFNSTDAFVIFQLASYQIPNFRSYGLDDWNFVPAAVLPFAKTTVNYPHVIEISNLLHDEEGLDFIAGINGDVNGTGNGLEIPKGAQNAVNFILAGASAPFHDLIRVPVKIETGGHNICALQFEIGYNHAQLEYTGYLASEMTPGADYWMLYVGATQEGKICAASFVMDPQQGIQYDGDLLYLDFRIKAGEIGLNQIALTFTGPPVAGGEDGYELPVAWNDGLLSIEAVVPPEQYMLKQNYPNPFNPATSIEFSLPQQGRVRLVIFNVMGEEISVLVNENLPAGIHRYSWDATGFASGVYFYRLMTESGFSAIKKLILLR
jgi:hypothetical protein